MTKKRKGAIVVAAILGLVAALYLAGLLAQVLNNYSIWMDGGGLTGQTQMPPVEFSPGKSVGMCCSEKHSTARRTT